MSLLDTDPNDADLAAFERDEADRLRQLVGPGSQTYTHSSLSVEAAARVLKAHATHFWRGELDLADKATAGHVAQDLGIRIAHTHVVLMRFHMQESSDSNLERLVSSLNELELIAQSADVTWQGIRRKAGDATDSSTSAAGNGFGSGFRRALSSLWGPGTVDDDEENANDDGLGSGDPEAAVARALEQELLAMSDADRARASLEPIGALAFTSFAMAGVSFRSGGKLDLLRGAYQMRKSWKYFESANELAEAYESRGVVIAPNVRETIRLGVAAFHFAVSLIPASLVWMVKLIGFEGNRDLAFDELKRCMQADTPRKLEASLLLAVILHFFQGDDKGACDLMDSAMAQHPGSPLLPSMNALFHRARGEIDQAIAMYNQAIDCGKELPQLQSMMCYHRGTCHYMLNDWERCNSDIERFLSTTSGKQFRPYGAFMQGVSLWHLGRKKETLALYEKIPTWTRPNQSYDAFAFRKSQECLANGGFTEFDSIFLAAYGLHHGMQFDQAIRMLERLVPILKKIGTSAENRDRHAQFYWLKGSCLKGKGMNPNWEITNKQELERGKQFLEKAAQQNEFLVAEKHIPPYAYFELGEIAAAQGDYAQAKQLWTFVQKTYHGYDWEKILNARIKSATDKASKKSSKV